MKSDIPPSTPGRLPGHVRRHVVHHPFDDRHQRITWEDGNEYPLAKVESRGEPSFFTGQMKIVDTAGRVERFEKRYGRRKEPTLRLRRSCRRGRRDDLSWRSTLIVGLGFQRARPLRCCSSASTSARRRLLTLRRSGSQSVRGQAWIVSMSDDLAALGGVLVWLDRHAPGPRRWSSTRSHPSMRLAAVLAPELRVWKAVGDTVVEAEPEPVPPALPRADDIAHLEAMLVDEGLDRPEDGLAAGVGLEIAVPRPTARSRSGCRRFDRFLGLHAGPLASCAFVLFPGASASPPRPVPWVAIVQPGAVTSSSSCRTRSWPGCGADHVEPFHLAPTARGRSGIAARRRRPTGSCGVLVGVDLGRPAIADLASVHAPRKSGSSPERDRLPYVERLASSLPVPASFRSIGTPWVD